MESIFIIFGSDMHWRLILIKNSPWAGIDLKVDLVSPRGAACAPTSVSPKSSMQAMWKQYGRYMEAIWKE